MVRLRHELSRLHATELRERPIRRFIAPDSLGWREQRITAVAVLVITIILIAMDDNLIADLPALHLRADRPDHARSIRTSDVERMLVAVERRHRNAQTGPNAVVIDAARHDVDEHFVITDRPGRHHLELEGFVGRPMPFLADDPGVHLLRHMPERRNLPDLIEILERSHSPRLGDSRHRLILPPDNSLAHIMLHRNNPFAPAKPRAAEASLPGEAISVLEAF